MGFITDEALYVGGMVVAAAAFILAIICFCVFQIKKVRLDSRMDEEYGKQKNDKKG